MTGGAEARREAELAAFGGRGHDVVRPARAVGWRAPVVFASPHSGDVYPPAFRAGSDQPLRVLARNADARVDDLFAGVTELGAPLISARFPRCYVDANRAGDDLPPEWADAWEKGCSGHSTPQEASLPASAYRADMGLGVVPLVIGERVGIYRHPPGVEAVRARLDALYRPYHGALADLLEEARSRFGRAVLVDCHSMPGFAAASVKGGRGNGAAPVRRADIVLGDGHGTTASADVVDRLEAAFERRGFRVVRNRPYAGGFSTLHYGRPHSGVEAVQIEINRDLYLNPATGRVKRGYGRLVVDLRGVCAEVIAGLAPDMRAAAE